jgi:hypothetical protein
MDRGAATTFLAEAEYKDSLASSEAVERLAVLATFDPGTLPRDESTRDALRLLCHDLPPHGGHDEAILLARPRVEALSRILARGGLPELARVRKSVTVHHDSPLQRMLDSFVLQTGKGAEARDEDELLASLDVWAWATEAIARAGLSARISVQPSREQLEGRLSLLEVTRAVRKLCSGGFVGREPELARLHDFRRTTPPGQSLVDDPAMVVFGIGGVGKSTLVARFVLDLYDMDSLSDGWPWAYLDLDRPTLSSCEPTVLLADIVRQVAAQLPEQRKLFDRSEHLARRRGIGAGLEGIDTATSHRQRAAEFASVMRSISGGSLLVVLDTYEELERHHPEAADAVYDLFATLAGELPSFHLVVSGRSPAEAFWDGTRPDRQMHVLPLVDDAAVALLRHYVRREAPDDPPDVDDDLARDIIGLVGGIPLTVRLAARVLVREGRAGIVDATQRAHAVNRVRAEFVRGFLYQRVLNHITTPERRLTEELRAVARASLAVRQVTVGVVQHVLLPAIEPVPRTEPDLLFRELATEVAFVERDGATLRLREDLRGPALAALKLEEPTLVTRVHALAASYYSGDGAGPANKVEHAYHRLVLGEPVGPSDIEVLDELRSVVPELPTSTAELVQRLHDPDELARDGGLAEWERKVAVEADVALRMGDPRRARALLGERIDRTAGGELHRLEAKVAEAEGDLPGAADAAGRELAAASAAADATRFAAAAVRLAALHERLEQAALADQDLAAAGEAGLVAGYPDLRLELLLNRMNLRERRGLDTDDSRWVLGLDARELIQAAGPRAASSTALVRLMGAALGRDEPTRLLAAVRLVGLGEEEDATRVDALISELVAWDSGGPEPGALARSLGLRPDPDDPLAVAHAWSAVSGLGTDAGLLLSRLWVPTPPPERVREAMRMIYLWWAVTPTDAERTVTPSGPPPQQTVTPSALPPQQPVDWTGQVMQSLEGLLLTAYPTSTDNQVLADRAGIDLSSISWSSSGRRITRELLFTAVRTGHLDSLVEVMLEDPAAVSIQPALRQLVGEQWLADHHVPPMS